MSLQMSYIEEEERLDLSFAGALDLTLSGEICHLCKRTGGMVRTCIVDLTNVERIFDSGVALLQMLYRRMCSLGATVIILNERAEFEACIPMITHAWQGNKA